MVVSNVVVDIVKLLKVPRRLYKQLFFYNGYKKVVVEEGVLSLSNALYFFLYCYFVRVIGVFLLNKFLIVTE